MTYRRVRIELALRPRWQLWPLYERLIPGFQLYLPFLVVTAYWD